jgi:DNA-binding NarL/FixJ family response regulator
MKKKIKVFLCDDHRLFREGVGKLLELEEDIRVIGEAGEGREALQKISRTNPDVVLMDIGMPGMDGVNITRKVKKVAPQVNIIMLTVYQDEPHIFEAIKAGAIGYILKDVSSDELIEAVRRVSRGEALIEPQIASKVLKEFKVLSRKKKSTEEEVYSELTGRENDVLRWIALGASNKEIASKLDISRKTVKNHLSNIFQKLHVNSRTKAALFVFQEKRDLRPKDL